MNRTTIIFLAKILSCATFIALTSSALAQFTTNWVAINDHHRGTTSSPYANFYNPFGDDAGTAGPLTNTVNYALLPQGAQTPATITIVLSGNITAEGSMSGPNLGTPAGDWFRPYVDFGSGNRDAIYFRDNVSTITYTFSGLDPSKRYVFKGTAARGNNYLDRWTMVTIEGVNSFTHAHRPTWAEAQASSLYGVITSSDVTTLNYNQAAWNSGENRAAGAMIVFTDIDPGPDGSFTIIVQKYAGSVPNGQSTAANRAYSFSAFSLEELIVSVNEPIQIISAPTNTTLFEGQFLSLSVAVLGSFPNFQWYKDGSPIPDATNRIYTVPRALPSDSGTYYVTVWNNINSTSTPPVTVTVISEPLVITNALQDLNVDEGANVTLTVGVSGTSPHYQWFKDGVEIAGATNASLTITNFAPENEGLYTVQITNSTSSVSSSARLTYVPDTVAPYIIAAVASTNYTTITVYISEAITNADDPWSWALYLPDQTTVAPFSAQQTNATTVVLTFEPGVIVYGQQYSVGAIEGNEIRDLSRQANLISLTPRKVAMYYMPLVSIDATTMWRFDSTDTDWSNAWYRIEFDDSGWSNGAALFEAKEGTIPALPEPVRTIMNRSNLQATARVTTYYFRTWFEFTGDDPTNTAIQIRTIIDDGAVFYLNGKEFFRLGMPSGTITHNTWANRTIGDATYEGPFTIILPDLVVGSNLLAVEVHQVNATSSDATMGIQVMGILPAIPPIRIVEPLSDITINEGETATFTVVATGVSPTYVWYKNGVEISGVNSPTYQIVNAKPGDSGVYTVMISNIMSRVFSSATLTVIPDTTPPALIMAVASTNLTNITLTFSERLDPITSQDPANYIVAPADGGPAVDVLSAVLNNWTNVILTTTPMTPGVIYKVIINNVADTSEAGNKLMNYSANIPAQVIIAPVWIEWKYENTGTDLSNIWYSLEYDDSGWQSGQALFGLESSAFVTANPINTPFTLTNAQGIFIPTFYFRTWFNFPYKTDIVKIAFQHAVDDGAVFYVNGVEVYRYNMPAGPVSFNTLASSSIDISDYTISPFITITNLVPGRNLLAVEVHQGSLTSSDVLFGAGVLAELTSFETVVVEQPVLLYRVDQGNIIFSWTGDGFRLQQNSDLNQTNWLDVPGGNSSPVSVPIGPGNMFFRLAK